MRISRWSQRQQTRPDQPSRRQSWKFIKQRNLILLTLSRLAASTTLAHTVLLLNQIPGFSYSMRLSRPPTFRWRLHSQARCRLPQPHQESTGSRISEAGYVLCSCVEVNIILQGASPVDHAEITIRECPGGRNPEVSQYRPTERQPLSGRSRGSGDRHET